MITNHMKTYLLLAILTAILLWIGSFWGNGGILFGLIFALIINFGTYFFSDKIVLKIYRAKEVKKNVNARLYGIIKEVAGLANLPMPKIYIIPSKNPNAFATGRNPKHAAIAVTEGILELLSDNELKGVLAHEMSHIKNRDILIQTVVATIAGVISYIGIFARWGALFGGFGGNRENNNLLQFLVMAIIAPIIALLLRLAISRSREYLADETGAKMIHNPLSLASALEKLEKGTKHSPLRFGSQATSSLFIVNPFKGKNLMNLLSTHPPTEKRVKKLRGMII
ncbi:MAG: zinc metalloprotease HtpX [Nanoarchaeota archaeon]|nr:zinc metalloprotease HtpX [Nanoarchaeota archaeon]